MSSDHWLFGDSTINAIEKIFKNKKVYKPHTVGLGCLQHPNGEEDQNKQTNNDSNEWYTFTFKLSYLLICPFSCLHSAGSCGAGSHASVTNQGHCAPCPFGTYQPDKWQEQCIPCPAGFTTYQRGAASKDLCLRQFTSAVYQLHHSVEHLFNRIHREKSSRSSLKRGVVLCEGFVREEMCRERLQKKQNGSSIVADFTASVIIICHYCKHIVGELSKRAG